MKMKSETREGNEGRAEEMERLGWSGREGEMDCIKLQMEVTAEMITCIN